MVPPTLCLPHSTAAPWFLFTVVVHAGLKLLPGLPACSPFVTNIMHRPIGHAFSAPHFSCVIARVKKLKLPVLLRKLRFYIYLTLFTYLSLLLS